MHLVTLANTAGQAEGWPHLAKRLCDKFGYQKVLAIKKRWPSKSVGHEKVLAMKSSSEATDAACKLARGWGVDIKQIDPKKVLVLGTSDNYHDTLSGVWPLMEPEAGWGGRPLHHISASPYNCNNVQIRIRDIQQEHDEHQSPNRQGS